MNPTKETQDVSATKVTTFTIDVVDYVLNHSSVSLPAAN